MAENIGFIGLGIMGRPMALNLVRGGHGLWIYARRAEAMQPLVEAGATACRSPAEVAEHAAVIFTMVSDTPDVEEVILGRNGVIATARASAIVVDMSTVSPVTTVSIARQLAAAQVHLLDAPVSGGEQGAVNGTLSIMVGGKPEVFERTRPLLELLGKNIVHVGDHGAGQIAKVCNQVVIAQTIAAVAEALVLATAAGADPARVREALLGGFAHSRVLEVHGQRMLERNFIPGFKAKLHQKDMRIALETAHSLGVPLPGAALAAQYVNALVGTGQGELDSAAIATLIEQIAGVNIGTPAAADAAEP